MGLDDFISEKEYKVGNVSSRKKMKNVNLDKKQWKNIFFHDPHYATYIAHHVGDSERKAIVGTLDEIIEGGIDGISASDEEMRNIREKRDTIVADHLR